MTQRSLKPRGRPGCQNQRPPPPWPRSMLRLGRIRFPLRWLAVALLPIRLSAQTERHTLSGDRIAVYNLAGKLRVQGGSGSQVIVDVTRAGRDASQLRVAQGDIRGSETLRVIYPSDQIVYPQLGYRSRTLMRVNSDGTFNDSDHEGRGSRRGRVGIRD